MRGEINRREMLSAAAGVAAVAAIVPRHVLGGANQTPPSERPNLAGVVGGGVGFGQMQTCEQAGFQVVALCDVDDVYAKKAFDRWPQARRYRDFREMLPAEDDKIDALYCGTPDHTHAVITVPALKRKKHVCCVKPLTRTIHECRTVQRAAKEAGVATQVTASPNTGERGCRTCELIWAGPLTEFVLLGNIAIRRGKPLDWDGENMRFTNDPDANKYVDEPYRDGWGLES